MGLIRRAKSFFKGLSNKSAIQERQEHEQDFKEDQDACQACGVDTSGMTTAQMDDWLEHMLMVYPSYMELKNAEHELENSTTRPLTPRNQIALNRAHCVCEYHHFFDTDDLQSVKTALQVRWQDGGTYVIPGEYMEDQINLEMATNICKAHNIGILGMPPQEIIKRGKHIYHKMYNSKVTVDTTNRMIDNFNQHERNRQPAYNASKMDMDEATQICREHGDLHGITTEAQLFNRAKRLTGARGSYLPDTNITVSDAQEMCENAYGFDATNMMSEHDMIAKAYRISKYE